MTNMLLISFIVGFAVPLAITDFVKAVRDGHLPLQADGFQVETRLEAWLLALVAGPGLLVDRLASGWREGEYSRSDLVNGAVIAAGWAGLYGFVFLKGVTYAEGLFI